MTVLLWQGSKLQAKYKFEASESSMTQLSDYLEESKEIPASIIIDVLEEEVTLTTIPHVAPHERKFLIDRAKTRLHRSTEFCTANVIGRDDNARRDDRLLVCGLTSDRVLLKWLDLFNQKNVRLKGIYSLPLISGNLLKYLGINKGLTLMVSRQSRDFIRQSIFKDGKLLYSRNIPSSQEFNIETVSSDLKKTKKYLENQRLVKTDDSINVIVLASDRFYQQLTGLDELLPEMNISYALHDELKKSLGIESDYLVGGQEIFSSLLLRSVTKNHYGRLEDLEKHKNKMRSDQYSLLSVAVAVIFVMMSVKLYLDIEVLDKGLEGIKDQVVNLKQENKKMTAVLSGLPAQAQKMKTFIENVNDVRATHETSIDKSMVSISHIFNAYSNISLQKMNWYLNADDYQSRQKNTGRSNKKKTKSKAGSHEQLIEITALIDLSSFGNEQAMKNVERFIASIGNIAWVKKAQIIKAPINTSSGNNMAGEISENKSSEAEFAFTVLVKGGDYAG